MIFPRQRAITTRLRVLAGCGVTGIVLFCTRPVAAQTPGTDFSGRGPEATRAELQAQLSDIQKLLASPAYSGSLKDQKRLEASMIQDRLDNGDFQVGDQIQVALSVPVDPTAPPINGPFTVGPGQMLELPGLDPIPLHGVLRSELEGYLSTYLSRFFKEQTVQAHGTIRLLISGGVGKPGFYQLPPETPLPDAIMQAGMGQTTKLDDTEIKRENKVIWTKEQVSTAIHAAATLDQLNLRAGDELAVGEQGKKDWWKTLRTIAIVPGLILSLVALGKLAGL